MCVEVYGVVLHYAVCIYVLFPFLHSYGLACPFLHRLGQDRIYILTQLAFFLDLRVLLVAFFFFSLLYSFSFSSSLLTLADCKQRPSFIPYRTILPFSSFSFTIFYHFLTSFFFYDHTIT